MTRRPLDAQNVSSDAHGRSGFLIHGDNSKGDKSASEGCIILGPDVRKAIADSGLYRALGGYYVNVPRPLATFEGTPPPGYTVLLVRFPCLANAQAFWNSRVYQEEIKPLRLDPSAGDYIVTVYAEAPVRPDMADAVGNNAYVREFDAGTVPQARP